MPTISINRRDLERLIGRTATDKDLDGWLPLVKGEVKDYDQDAGELRIELQDSNRPDLWCCEGIARQIRVKRQGSLARYHFLTTPSKSPKRLNVAPGLEEIRPYVAACTATGYRVTQDGLAQLIQT